MCIGEGQVQAGLLRRGLGVCCSGGGRGFSKDLTDGRGVAFKVVAAREVLVKEGCSEGMHGRVCEHGAPAVDQGVGEGVAQEGWGLAGFGVGEESQERRGFITPASSNFNPKHNKAASPVPEEFGVGSFLVPPRVP